MALIDVFKQILYKTIKAGGELVGNEQYSDRKAICENCTHYKNVTNVIASIPVTDLGCELCNCYIETKGRMRIVTSKMHEVVFDTKVIKCEHKDGNKWAAVDQKYLTL
jgi:hypothetical protein